MKYLFLIPFLYLQLPAAKAQQKPLSCAGIRAGIFHSYPGGNAHYIYIKDSSFQQEINIAYNDTSTWQISWLDDCTYRLRYAKGKIDSLRREFILKHTMLIKVKSFGGDFYTYDAYIDDTGAAPVASDTIWSVEKYKPAEAASYQIIRDEVAPDQNSFGPKASYALVYIYRPGKLTNSLGNYLINIDGHAVCVAKNNSGYIFRVYHEGPVEVKSSLYKDESAVQLNLRFGHSYYVKSMIHWTITGRLNNFKLETVQMPAAEGAEEFDAVIHRPGY